MKLYQTYLSPFPTRVRLVLYAKGLDIPFVEPPGIHDGSGKGDYLNINPLGRVPTLELRRPHIAGVGGDLRISGRCLSDADLASRRSLGAGASEADLAALRLLSGDGHGSAFHGSRHAAQELEHDEDRCGVRRSEKISGIYRALHWHGRLRRRCIAQPSRRSACAPTPAGVRVGAE